jgi:hypothetical protein
VVSTGSTGIWCTQSGHVIHTSPSLAKFCWTIYSEDWCIWRGYWGSPDASWPTITFLSKALGERHKALSIYEKEFLALIMAV